MCWQTIENNEPPESAGSCLRFFKRKTHAPDMLAGKLKYAVLYACMFGCVCVCVCVLPTCLRAIAKIRFYID